MVAQKQKTLFMSVPDAGALQHYGKTQSWAHVRAGDIPSVMLGGRRFVWRADVDKSFDPASLGLPDVLNVRQVAAALGIGKTKAYEFMRLGIIPSERLGRSTIIVKRDALLRLHRRLPRHLKKRHA